MFQNFSMFQTIWFSQNVTLTDLTGLVLAIASQALLLAAPGAALAQISGAMGFETMSRTAKTRLAVVAGLALLPGLDSLVTRCFCLDAALAFNLVLAAIAAGLAWKNGCRPAVSAAAIAILTLWFVILAFEFVDVEASGGLYQSFTALDMVKHAATSQAILDTGAPPHDPFFARPERVSYYYFFYTLTALSQRLCLGFADARAAVAGLCFWTGIGIYALARLLIERCGLAALDKMARVRPILLVLLAAGGLDIIFILRLGLVQHTWAPDPTWWTDDVANWFEAVIWVPHHLSGLIAGLTGFMVLAPALSMPRRHHGRAIITAALCFVSALGLSVWLSLVAVATAALWCAVLLFERRWRDAALLTLTGCLALLVASPVLRDLIAGRPDGAPIAFAVRAFSPVDALVHDEPWRSVARLAALPLNCFAEFGILFTGSLMFWRAHRWRDQNELARVITLAAAAGLLLGSFWCSTVFDNNDLGWRVFMVPQLAGLLWTTAAFTALWETRPEWPLARSWRLLPGLPLAVLMMGFGTTAYAMVSLRFHTQMQIKDAWRLFTPRPAIDLAERNAYRWANTHLPQALVLQHNPEFGRRVVDFGLYSRNPVGVSDVYGALYGAAQAAVERRLFALMPVFAGDLSDDEVVARARAQGIGALVVSAKDSVWSNPGSWVWHARPIYDDGLVRIINVKDLGTATAAR